MLTKLVSHSAYLKKRFIQGIETTETKGIPWTPFKKPLSECKVALVTTAGIHHKDQLSFDMMDKDGDPSFRVIDSTRSLNSIMITLKSPDGQQTRIPRFGLYAILIQMLAYVAWHHGKPVPELVGTFVWGICAAAIALRIRSIWPIILSHWLYNILLDVLIWGVYPLLGIL